MSIKTVITRKDNNVIIDLVKTIATVENGLLVSEFSGSQYIITCVDECNVYEGVEVADTIVSQKYTYNPTDGFKINTNYKEPVAIDDLQSQVNAINVAIANMMGV